MEISGGRKSEVDSQTTPVVMASKTVKRPFDVAFLMLPDEKLKQKQAKKLEVVEVFNNNDEDEDVDIEDNPRDYKLNHKYFTQKQQIFDDPNLIKTNKILSTSIDQKSAFTKVNLTAKDPRLSPNLSISPDLSYQHSLSPSPPIVNHRTYPNFLSPTTLFKNQPYQTNFLPENFAPPLENHFLVKNRSNLYRPDLTYNYQPFSSSATSSSSCSTTPQDLKVTQTPPSNPAAAILTSLLPPSLAALSLPAQNVCAKCNITFRMTSDLVYHMRSHHKNETNDMNKRRREEKLKCPVCAESFRERHHLTRHMTAHQDKEDDDKERKKVLV